ncbi:2-aminomuconic semialdehyde dehydrogenase-like [Lineus longissimus]|uniref:2-aminomuconic semialdehyde dehydrogenase-like n=1 Tax=Lineus longissimus TaxID=88925 RepID=UPI002B4D1F13
MTSPQKKRTKMTEFEVKNYINGQFIDGGETIDNYDPSTGKVYSKVPDSSAEEVNLAIAAAKSAFLEWSASTPQERSKVMMKIADILESRLDEFAKAESRDQGKTVTVATTVDIPRAVYNFRFFATAILHYTQSSSTLDGVDAINYVTRDPVGVAGLISPWNLPLYLLTFKIAPCIATGNTCVCKPSEMTSVTAWMLCEVFREAGLPPGVVNMVFGTGPRSGQALVQHPDVHLISFTGSTPTAEKIQHATAPFCKKLSLELGGKNAGIVFNDADLEKCIPTMIRSSFANQGEICLCTSRIFVQHGIYSEFLEKFVKATRAFKVGDPADKSSQMGALISKEHYEKVSGYVKLAEMECATINCGHRVDQLVLPPEKSEGYFMLPTVITDVSDVSRLMQEEIFGPVTCIVPFHTEEEVVARANGVKYGLCASVWAQDVGVVHRVGRKLKVGTVWCNCWLVRDLNMPFGGVKSSGIGSEGYPYSLEFFTEAKTICIKTS